MEIHKLTHEEAQVQLQASIDDIIANAAEAVTPQWMLDKMVATAAGVGKSYAQLRLNLLTLCGLFIDDNMVENASLEKEMLTRFVCNELLMVTAYMVRGLKRRAGEDLVPARFAMVAYAIAESVAKLEWDDAAAEESLQATLKPGEFRAGVEAAMTEALSEGGTRP
jgi:hypothetical protein